MGKKILVIRFSSIGDIVLTTPVLRALHEQAGADVHVLTKESFAPLLAHNPHVAHVHTLTADWNDMLARLKAEQFDHVVDLHNNLRSLRVKLALGMPATSFRKLNMEKWLLVRFGVDRLPSRHIVDRYMDTVSGLGIVPDGQGLDFFIPPDKEVDVAGTLGVTPGTYACVAVGAAHATKCMTAEQIARLTEELKMPAVLMGGPGDHEKAEHIIQLAAGRSVINTCGRFDILQSGSILRQAGPIVNHDSGLMHIAAALKKPQVVVWGNTVPAFGMYPYYGQQQVECVQFEQTELRCRPCSKLGYPACPKGHFRCMLDHDIGRIANAACRMCVRG